MFCFLFFVFVCFLDYPFFIEPTKKGGGGWGEKILVTCLKLCIFGYAIHKFLDLVAIGGLKFMSLSSVVDPFVAFAVR